MNQSFFLIVDDQKLNRLFLSKTLEEFEYLNYFECTNGYEAITWLKTTNQKKVIVFLDINMPIMDGYEFLEYVEHNLTEFNHVDIQIIVVSASSREDFEKRIPNANIVKFLSKPFNMKQVKLAVDKANELFMLSE